MPTHVLCYVEQVPHPIKIRREDIAECAFRFFPAALIVELGLEKEVPAPQLWIKFFNGDEVIAMAVSVPGLVETILEWFQTDGIPFAPWTMEELEKWA